MTAIGTALDAMDSKVVLAGAAAVVAFVSLIAVALGGHVVMKPVRETVFGKWASLHAEARMDRIRAAFTARKGTKAGAP